MIWLFILCLIGMAAYLSSRSAYTAMVITRLLCVAAIGWACVIVAIYAYSGRDIVWGAVFMPPVALIGGVKLLSWAFSDRGIV